MVPIKVASVKPGRFHLIHHRDLPASLSVHPRRLKWLVPVLCLSLLITTSAQAFQESLPVTRAIENFLKIQTQGLPGQTSFTITPLDPRNNLAPCKDFSIALTPGSRLWGHTSVMVRCLNEGGWKIYVPLRIRVQGEYLVTARALSQGQSVSEADLTRNNGDLTALPDGLLTDMTQAIGRVVTQSLPAGRPLRGDLLRQAAAVQQGQSVKVLAKGTRFQVTRGDGRALNNATEGQVAQVRMSNGQIISGIARAGGVVEISY